MLVAGSNGWANVRVWLFAHTQLLSMASEALENLADGLAEAVGILENRGARRPIPRAVVRRLRALIASGGHTSNHRRVPAPSNSALEGPGELMPELTFQGRRVAYLEQRGPACLWYCCTPAGVRGSNG